MADTKLEKGRADRFQILFCCVPALVTSHRDSPGRSWYRWLLGVGPGQSMTSQKGAGLQLGSHQRAGAASQHGGVLQGPPLKACSGSDRGLQGLQTGTVCQHQNGFRLLGVTETGSSWTERTGPRMPGPHMCPTPGAESSRQRPSSAPPTRPGASRAHMPLR